MARTRKVEVITEAKPHTIKKFELIEKYVEAWAYKILNYHGNPGYAPASGVIFIDCMSNSGVYKGMSTVIVLMVQHYVWQSALIMFLPIIPTKKQF